MDKITKRFRDGVPGDLTATDLNQMVSLLNQLMDEAAQLRSQLKTDAGSQMIVAATRPDNYEVPANGRRYTTGKWANRIPTGATWLGAGFYQVPEGTPQSWYEIRMKALVSVDKGSYPRIKMVIRIDNEEVAIAEDNLVKEGGLSGGAGANFAHRKTIQTFAFSTLRPGQVIAVDFYFWNDGFPESQATVEGSSNTMLTIRRDPAQLPTPGAGGN